MRQTAESCPERCSIGTGRLRGEIRASTAASAAVGATGVVTGAVFREAEAGERPQMRQVVVEGDVGLSV